MRYALSARSRDLLKQFATARTAIAFDFDGTLAPIVNDPERARMRGTTRQLLRRLAGVQPCLALSGRSRAELQTKLDGSGIHYLIGNHGAESGQRRPGTRGEVRQWERTLLGKLPKLDGLWIENKTLSLTIHYRQCRRKAEARAAIAKAVGALAGVRLIDGKQAVSVTPESAPNKGDALRAAVTRCKCDRAVYVGDDQTDEDVFALGKTGPLLFSIRVGRKSNSLADYYLRNQEEIDDLLRLLLQLSAASK
jgi:trehalose 6-phosphate phosphatase